MERDKNRWPKSRVNTHWWGPGRQKEKSVTKEMKTTLTAQSWAGSWERMVASQQRSSTETGSRSPHTNAELPMGSQVSAGLNEVCLMKEESLASRKGTALGMERQHLGHRRPGAPWFGFQVVGYSSFTPGQGRTERNVTTHKYIACWGMASMSRQHIQQSSCIIQIWPFQEEFNSLTTHAICSYENVVHFCRG